MHLIAVLSVVVSTVSTHCDVHSLDLRTNGQAKGHKRQVEMLCAFFCANLAVKIIPNMLPNLCVLQAYLIHKRMKIKAKRSNKVLLLSITTKVHPVQFQYFLITCVYSFWTSLFKKKKKIYQIR